MQKERLVALESIIFYVFEETNNGYTMSKEGTSRSRTIAIVGVAVVCIAVVAVLGWQFVFPPSKPEPGPPEEELKPIKIGSVAPLTGYLAVDGIDMRNGMILALEDINYTILGRPVEFICEDGRNLEAEVLSSAYEKLCTVDKVDVIMIGYGGSSIYDICQKHGMLFIHADTNTVFTDYMLERGPDEAWMLFMSDPDNAYYGKSYTVLLDKLIEAGQFVPWNKKFYVLYSSYDYDITIARVFKEEMEKRGWECIGEEGVSDDLLEWGPSLTKIRSDPPSVILQTHAFPPAEVGFLKEFLMNPTKSLVFQHYSPSIPEYLDLAGEKANGVVWAVNLGIEPTPEGLAWFDRYKERFGVRAGYTQGPNCYDDIMMYKTAVETVGTTDKRIVAEAIEDIQYEGLCGTYVFNQTIHECLSADEYLPFWTYQIWDGEHVCILPEMYAQADLEMPPWWEEGRTK